MATFKILANRLTCYEVLITAESEEEALRFFDEDYIDDDLTEVGSQFTFESIEEVKLNG